MVSELKEVPVRRWNAEAKEMEDTGATQERLAVGTVVKVTNETGRVAFGLVTAVHGPECVNVVYVSHDEAKHDPYGNQLERLSSLQKKSDATAQNGRFYEHI